MTINQVIFAMNAIKDSIGGMAEAIKDLEDSTPSKSNKPEDHLERILKYAASITKNGILLLEHSDLTPAEPKR